MKTWWARRRARTHPSPTVRVQRIVASRLMLCGVAGAGYGFAGTGPPTHTTSPAVPRSHTEKPHGTPNALATMTPAVQKPQAHENQAIQPVVMQGAGEAGTFRLPTVTPCREPANAQALPFVPPPNVTGQVGFYLAVLDARTTEPRVVISSNADTLFPLASAYKQLLVWSVLKDVDQGRLSLGQRVRTTEANRSIERYSQGWNSLLALTKASIQRSENTAADILHLLSGPERVQKLVEANGACRTSVLLTTKAFWSAQAGLVPSLFPPEHLERQSRAFFELSPPEKQRRAAELVRAAQQVSADVLLQRLDTYFTSPRYLPQVDVYLQNTSTPRDFARLLARMYLRSGLNPNSERTLREIMATGCCRAPRSALPYTYWAAKAGSGWRLLTLSGFVELRDGTRVVYAYMNHQSETLHAEDLERTVPRVTSWIADSIGRATR